MVFLTLPDDLWTEIIDFCNNITIDKLFRTCRFFREVKIKNYNIIVRKFSDINQNSINYQRVTSLEVHFDEDLIFEKFHNIIPPNLRKIKFNTNNYENIYQYYFSRIKTLTSLSLNNSNITKYPENLLELELNYCTGNFNNFPKNLKTLKLSINFDTMIYNNNCSKIIFPNKLEKLKLECVSSFQGYYYLSDLPSTLKSLECIDFCILPNQLPERLEELILYNNIDLSKLDENSFRNIKKLVIMINYATIISFEKLLYSMDKLEELEISSNLLKELSLPKTLRKLHLNINNIDDFYLEKFDLNNLTYLFIENLDRKSQLENIYSENLIELVLNGKIIIQNINTPKLKILTLKEEFKGKIIIPKTVTIFRDYSERRKKITYEK